jgi:Lrp/AsnC family transcriptional regulator for asnA, asnC and gidA
MSLNIRIDSLDMKILRLLQQNARIPYLEIARVVGVNEATVRKRVERLVKKGIIQRFTVILDYHKLGRTIKAFIGLKVQPAKLREIVDKLTNHPEVHVLYRTSGDTDIMLEVIFEHMEDLSKFLEEELKLEGILGTNVMIVMGPYKKCPWTGI